LFAKLQADAIWIKALLTDTEAGPFGDMKLSVGSCVSGYEGLEECRKG